MGASTALATVQCRMCVPNVCLCMIGASTALATVQCCILGVSCANFGLPILDAVGQKNPIARGVAMGGSGLALAAAALAKDDPAAFPFGTLTMSLTSTFSTVFFRWTFFLLFSCFALYFALCFAVLLSLSVLLRYSLSVLLSVLLFCSLFCSLLTT